MLIKTFRYDFSFRKITQGFKTLSRPPQRGGRIEEFVKYKHEKRDYRNS